MSWGRLLCGAVVVALAVPSLASCGGGTDAAPQPSKAASDCRRQWKDLEEEIAPHAALERPSALPERWNTVAATVDYYRTSATGADCGSRIDAQKRAIAALEAFSVRLVPLDMEAQLAAVQDAAKAYAAGPWPPAPSPTATPNPGKKGKKGKKKAPTPPRPPKPSVVATALATLTAQAPVAGQQQGPGWQQASVVDLDDTAAVTKAVKDLQFLSTESSAWRACQSALATIHTALAAKTS